VAILDSDTFRQMENMLYQHKHIDNHIAMRRESLLIPHRGGDANRGFRSEGSVNDPVGDPVVRIELDPYLNELKRQKEAVERTMRFFKDNDSEKYQLVIMRYFRDWSAWTIKKKLGISQTTYQTWRLEVLNYLHKACIDGRLLSL
jgi:RinA family phage transcriptional activator